MDGFKRQNGQQFNSRPNNNRQIPPLGAAPRPAPRAIDPNQPMGQRLIFRLTPTMTLRARKCQRRSVVFDAG